MDHMSLVYFHLSSDFRSTWGNVTSSLPSGSAGVPCVTFPHVADATLVLLSVPLLRGWLTLTCFTREKLVREMIVLFWGLCFCYMDLFRVGCIQLLLNACSKTLQTLRLYPSDEYGKEFFERTGGQALTISICHGTIPSRHLRPLWNQSFPTSSASDFLRTVLSSITHSALLDVVIVYLEPDFGDMAHDFFCTTRPQPCYTRFLWMHLNSAQRCQRQFEVFHKMHNVREFRLPMRTFLIGYWSLP